MATKRVVVCVSIYTTDGKEQEIEMLENRASNLESQLDQIKSRIKQLKEE